MIDDYKIKNVDGNNELFLYINYKYVSKIERFDLFYHAIINDIHEYILEHKIVFDGNKINLVINGIVQKSVNLTQIINLNIGNYIDNNIVDLDNNFDVPINFDVNEIVEDISI